MSNFIHQDLYDKFLINMPIICTDLLIFYKDNYLLIRRKDEPARGQLWFPGSRIRKGELGEQAAIRIAKEEVGLNCTVRKSLGFYETIFDTGPNNIPVHSVNLCYLLHASDNKVRLDSTSSEYIWVPTTRCPTELDQRLKNFVEEVFGEY